MNLTHLSVVLFGVLVFLAPAQAHRPDTSYARFKVTRDALESSFTYDLFTLQRIAPGLDANADRQVTSAELAVQVPIVVDYLRQHVQLEIDGQSAELGDAQPVTFPPGVGDAIEEQNYHDATSLVRFDFRRSVEKAPADFWVRFDLFVDLGEQHTVLGAIAQEGEEYELLFRFYEPDFLYDTGYVPAPLEAPEAEHSDAGNSLARVPPQEPTPGKPLARSNTDGSRWGQLASFFRLGVEHIFLGYDHILFLLSLIVVCKFGELVKIVTSFTVAHTITLVLATLLDLQLPSRLIETAIAATIVYVAAENFWIEHDARRWRLTFAFGLIHGFGFAGVLRELGLPTVGLVRSLFAFNVGVEAGQLAIVLTLLPITTALAKWKHGHGVRLAISGAVAVCGVCWFIDRVFGLGAMPF